MSSGVVLRIRGLTVLDARTGAAVLDRVDLDVERNAVVAIVGESGSGKTSVLNAILGLLPAGLRAVDGSAVLHTSLPDTSVELIRSSAAALRRVRGRHLGYVPQDCLQGLDPLMSLRDQMRESIRCHARRDRAQINRIAVRALRRAGLSREFVRTAYLRRPGQISGGERQRVMIARARVHNPELVLYDEPTTALDPVARDGVHASIRAGLRSDSAALLVTHDLVSLPGIADRVFILFRGRIVESGPTRAVLGAPMHPYTRDLLGCLPTSAYRGLPRPMPEHSGSAERTLQGCPYQVRCALRRERCSVDAPVLERCEHGREVACHVR